MSRIAYLYAALPPTKEQEERFLAFLKERYHEEFTLEYRESKAYPGGFRLEVGEITAENVKKILGNAVPRPESPRLEISGKDLVEGGPRCITIGEGHIREALYDCIQTIVGVVLRTLERTPPELAADIHRNGLLMAGGGSLLKGLDQRIARETRLKVFVDDEPLTTVLRGTAKAMLDRERYQPVFIN